MPLLECFSFLFNSLRSQLLFVPSLARLFSLFRWLPGGFASQESLNDANNSDKKPKLTTDESAVVHQEPEYIYVAGPWKDRTFQMPEAQPNRIVYVTKGDIINVGVAAVVEKLPSDNIVTKTALPHTNTVCEEEYRRRMRIEAHVYKRLGVCSQIPKLIKWDTESCCLALEYIEKGDLGTYLGLHPGTSLETRLRWARQAAKAVHVLHSHGIIHCDIAPRNFLIDGDGNLRITDFGGASICGSKPSAIADTRYLRPTAGFPVTFHDDIFSLGSLIYFLMAQSHPYHELSCSEVERNFALGNFPDVSKYLCSNIIRRCWQEKINNADEVLQRLERIQETSCETTGES